MKDLRHGRIGGNGPVLGVKLPSHRGGKVVVRQHLQRRRSHGPATPERPIVRVLRSHRGGVVCRVYGASGADDLRRVRGKSLSLS